MPIEDVARAWAEPLGLGLAAMLAAFVAYRIGERLVERLTRHSRALCAVIERLRRPLQVLLPLAALDIVLDGVSDTLQGIETVRHLGGVLLIAVCTWVAIAGVRGMANAVSVLNPRDVADNLRARRILTQTRVLSHIATGVLIFAGVAFILMTFPRARQFGTSLLASAGLSALVLGLAARSVFSNLLAGLQIALSQPLRIDDVLIVEGEWGRVEEITGTYVILKIWDERRLVIPLQWFIEHPFQNWTRTTAQIIGSVMLWVDYTTDLEPLREEASRLAKASKDHDGRVCLLQVVDTSERSMQLRLIVSSPSAGQNWDLRCLLREGLIAYVRRHQPEALPRLRMDLQRRDSSGDGDVSESVASHNASRQLQGRLAGTAPRERGGAAVSDATGMSELAGPTGGSEPAKVAELADH
ncbi:MAG TPA: mechanosensitive ion channel domain-containing protein [Polyangiaceae bacterium]|nr:mechanosensitive ion channel domain-containing protein [Polyangiaceae bacterium]